MVSEQHLGLTLSSCAHTHACSRKRPRPPSPILLPEELWLHASPSLSLSFSKAKGQNRGYLGSEGSKGATVKQPACACASFHSRPCSSQLACITARLEDGVESLPWGCWQPQHWGRTNGFTMNDAGDWVKMTQEALTWQEPL